MSALPLTLRRVSAEHALASRRLGQGVRLGFEAHGAQGCLELLPLAEPPTDQEAGTWLQTGAGPLCLTNADAVLSLLGEVPAVLEGELQPWYWQLLDQNLAPALRDCLAPLGLVQPMDDALLHCRVRVELEHEWVHALLAVPAAVLIRLLDGAHWQVRRAPLDEAMPLPVPLLLGTLSLTVEQLASLRPGDVLLPPHCLFDTDGNGRMEIAGNTWHVATGLNEGRLLLHIEP